MVQSIITIVFSVLFLLIISVFLTCYIIAYKCVDALVFKKKNHFRYFALSKGMNQNKEKVKAFKARYEEEIKKAKKIEITSFDNLKLNAYFIEGEKKDTVVISLPGCRADATISYGTWSYLYRRLGYSVLAIDSRATGLSEGNFISFGEYESSDLLFWIKKVKELMGDKVNIIIAGVSMGGHTALINANKYDNNVKGVIADSAYTSLGEQFLYMLNEHLKFKLFNKMIVVFMSIILKRKTGVDCFNNKTTLSVRDTKCPILLVTSDFDSVVDPSFSYLNYLSNEKMCELKIIEHSDHLLNPFTDEEGYLKMIDEFISKCLNK